jgi:threonyl-tRNA synthetase
VRERLAAEGLRVEADLRQEKVNYKIREAQMQKIPYMLVVGDREMAGGQVALRSRSAGDQGAVAVDVLIDRLKAEVASKGLEPAAS